MGENLVKRTRKNYGLLKTSWSYQTKHFFANSSLHGVRYIAEEGRPTFEKVMWLCLVSIGAIVTLVIIVSLWEKFQTNPTITGLDTDFHSFEVAFPGISLCPTIPTNETRVQAFVTKTWGSKLTEEKMQYYSKFVNSLANLSYETLGKMATFKDDKSLPQVKLRDLVYEVVERCENIIKDCNWKGEEYECCKGFYPSFTENGFCYSFNSIYSETTWPWKGAKFTPDLQIKYIYETDSKWAISFNSYDLGENHLKVYIHSTEELPGADMAPQHVYDRKISTINFASRMTYTTADARQLSAKQRRCVFEDEIKLPTHPKYSYWACMAHCRMVFAKRKCGCVPFFYKKADGFPYCNINGMACLFEFTAELGSSMNCGCQLGCTNTVYEVEKLADTLVPDRLEPLEIGFVSWPMIRYKREVLFGWVDLLVSFGGIAGLFLGFSLLSGVEVVYYFTLRAACMVKRDRPEIGRLQEEEKLRTRREPDLSLKPKLYRQYSPQRRQQEHRPKQQINKINYINIPFLN